MLSKEKFLEYMNEFKELRDLVDDLNIVLNSVRCRKMIDGFKQNKKCEELCKHCSFLEK